MGMGKVDSASHKTRTGAQILMLVLVLGTLVACSGLKENGNGPLPSTMDGEL